MTDRPSYQVVQKPEVTKGAPRSGMYDEMAERLKAGEALLVQNVSRSTLQNALLLRGVRILTSRQPNGIVIWDSGQPVNQ